MCYHYYYYFFIVNCCYYYYYLIIRIIIIAHWYFFIYITTEWNGFYFLNTRKVLLLLVVMLTITGLQMDKILGNWGLDKGVWGSPNPLIQSPVAQNLVHWQACVDNDMDINNERKLAFLNGHSLLLLLTTTVRPYHYQSSRRVYFIT